MSYENHQSSFKIFKSIQIIQKVQDILKLKSNWLIWYKDNLI